MNRRNFINNLLTVGAAFTILPGANRLWVPTESDIIAYRYNIFQFDREIPTEYGKITTFKTCGTEFMTFNKKTLEVKRGVLEENMPFNYKELPNKQWVREKFLYIKERFNKIDEYKSQKILT